MITAIIASAFVAVVLLAATVVLILGLIFAASAVTASAFVITPAVILKRIKDLLSD